MARTTVPERMRLKGKLLHGVDALWSIVRRLDAAGPWAVPDVEGETNRPRNVAGNFVRALAKAGIATEMQSDRRTKYGRPIKLYRLLARPDEAPRLRYDGRVSGKSGQHQEQLWTAARRLKQFSARELAYTASTDGPIPLRTAQWYLQHLHDAGFVSVAHETANGHLTYRVKAAAEAKPKAPRVLRLNTVYDPNSDEVLVTAIDEVRP